MHEEYDDQNPIITSDEVPTKYDGSICCDPGHRVHRFIVLIFICFLSFGSYFCYDNPAALQDNMESDLGINTATFMNFYAFYSWPNVILSFIGGFLIDRVFGIRLGAIVFSAFVLAGQLLFALGAFLNLVWFMDLGRFVFGIGGENLAVAQNTYAVSWFKDRELNLVFGLQLSFSRVGSTLNLWTMKPIYNAIEKGLHSTGHTTLGYALLFAGVMCLLSLAVALIMAFFDSRAARLLHRDAGKTGEVIKLSDIKNFPLNFWLICLICVAYYVAIFPFVSIGLVFFENKFNMDPEAADIVNSLVYFVSLGGSPVFGFLIDMFGKNIFWVIAGIIITIGCHGLLAFTFVSPYIGMVGMGLAYSMLASALWPMVALAVPEHQLGTAYGIMQSVQNLGLAIIAILAGTIVDSKGYLILEVFFLVWLFVSLIAGVILYLSDSVKNGFLNLSSKERKIYLENRKIAENKDK